MTTLTESMSAVRPARRRRNGPGRATVILVRVSTIVVLLVLWEVTARLFPNPYIAPPTEVVAQGVPFVLQPLTLIALAQTGIRFVQAFVIVVILGIPIGILLGRLHRQSFEASRDVVNILYALPLVPFYPIFVLWLGLGAPSEIAFGAIHGLVPVVLLIMSASAAVPATLVDAARTMGARAGATTVSVVVPAIRSDVFGALKIGTSLCMLGVLLGELMISVDGVGALMAGQIENHQGPHIDALIIVVCLSVVVINAVLSAVDRALEP